MKIEAMVMANWLCYRGDHALELGPGAYAVTAARGDDQTRSNGTGKTAIAELPDFVLWGRHRHATEDAWITRGEPFGEGRLILTGGHTIIRRRERGKATRLTYHGPLAPTGAIQDEAQKIVAQLVGLSPEDFTATCYLRQREMARLVLSKPEERMEVVRGWLRLGPVERCADRAEAEAAAIAKKVDEQEAKAKAAEDLIKQLSGDDGHPDGNRQRIRTAAQVDVDHKLVAAVHDARVALDENEHRIRWRDRMASYEQAVREAGKVQGEVAGNDGAQLHGAHEDAVVCEREAGQARRMAKSQVEQLATVARGEFDGVCPVAGITCPATVQINTNRRGAQQLHKKALEVLQEASDAYDAACRTEAGLRADHQAHGRAVDRLKILCDHVAKLTPAHGEETMSDPEDPVLLRTRLDRAEIELREANDLHDRAKRAHEQFQQLDDVVHAARTLAATYRAELAIATRAAAVFGRQGAQRRIAEGAIGEIEGRANDFLADAGIDLRVEVRWSREGKGLARACARCTKPFPASTKVRECASCGATRGPLLVNRLEVDLEPRSGALEDLAGIALTLAAGAWLRADRGSPWASAVVDEPFGACDAHNRRALGRRLARLLDGGLEQAFVIAHDRHTLEGMPRRIEVVAGRDGSSVRVAA